MYTATPETNINHTKLPTCMISSTEEGVTRRVKAFENKMGRNNFRMKVNMTVFQILIET